MSAVWHRVGTHAHRDAPTSLTALCWNLKDGRDPRSVVHDVTAVVDLQLHPQLLVFQEARRYGTALRRALPGYRMVVARGWAESSNVVVFVRRDVPLARWRALRFLTGWVGPKAFRRHAGRTFLVVDLGSRWRIVGVHMPPGGPTGGVLTHGQNRAAYTEAAHGLEQLDRRKSSRARALAKLGDWNADLDDPHPTAPAEIARVGGSLLVPAGGGPDYAMVRGCTGRGRRGQNLGSDHPYRTFTFTQETP